MLESIKMDAQKKLSAFAKYAWFTLACNIVVILWGVFLRASKSGDGCGRYWLTCKGEIIPSAPELKTIIEFAHRLMSGVDLLIVIGLVVWAFLKFKKSDQVRKFALLSFIFIVTEALVGAGLVLTGNTAESLTAARPFWSVGHLINTFILLASLSLTAWVATNGIPLRLRASKKILALLGVATIGIILVGSSGSLAALSSMLFPANSIWEGIQQDFSSSSHGLLRLRISHPILSVGVSVFLVFLAGWLKSEKKGERWTSFFGNTLILVLIVQVIFGALTLLTLAPILMQVGHLLLADAVWISFVLMSASFLSESNNDSILK